MYTSNSAKLSLLDSVRINYGTQKLKSYFYRLSRYSRRKTISLINDNNLHFATLFVLQPEIRDTNFYRYLNLRNKKALEITNAILKTKSSNVPCFSSDQKQSSHTSLKWILQTGRMDDGLNDDFDEVIEKSAILLIKLYRDNSLLHIIIEMIFKKHRKGTYTHDLVWAFFEAKDIQSLNLISDYLTSEQPEDVNLARKLLSFIPVADSPNSANQHRYISNWLKENNPFLNYTGESFQQGCNPRPYILSLESKYLCRAANGDIRKSITSLPRYEQNKLEVFNLLDNDTKILLSNYSFWLHNQNIYWWNLWHDYPIIDQISIAKAGLGGIV